MKIREKLSSLAIPKKITLHSWFCGNFLGIIRKLSISGHKNAHFFNLILLKGIYGVKTEKYQMEQKPIISLSTRKQASKIGLGT